jgi:hypothetical protein
MAQFLLGKLYSTEGVAAVQSENAAFADFVWRSLQRYLSCDWGEMSKDDLAMNDSAIGPDEARILAAYEHPDNPDWKIWIITESDRSCTTILFPDEY